MKMRVAFVIPLPDQVVELVQSIPRESGSPSFSLAKARQESCTQMPYAPFCMKWNTNTLPDTAFGLHFGTGQARAQIILAKSAKWRLLMTNATKLKGRTLALTFSTNDEH